MMNKLVRPLTLEEHWHVIDYFYSGSDTFLQGMGVDRNRLIAQDEWFTLMETEYNKTPGAKSLYYVGWVCDGELIGHSNVNQLTFADHANVHLHMWDSRFRKKGLGECFFKSSVNHFFREFRLTKIICEPYAHNPAPNKLLQKLGLQPTRTYRTIPGIICFEQTVNRYEIVSSFPA